MSGIYWINAHTQEAEWVEGSIQSDEQALRYIPEGGAQGIYKVLRALDVDIQNAMLGALGAAVGEDWRAMLGEHLPSELRSND